MSLLSTGDYERALDYFLRSRELYASPPNTIDAALCLDRLGRYDESLEMYESALATLSDKLDASDRAAIATATEALLQKVANLDVSASANGTVVIDGRQRGKLPLSAALRLLPGKHVLRIVADGYRTYETTIEVKAGDRARVDGTLEPLAAAGQLRIEDPGNDGADVVVDGATVGKSPWEGTLGPGPHAVWSVAGEQGSAPTSVIVLQGQTALVRLRSGPLGPKVSVTVRPETAAIALDGVAMGTGSFAMRLPADSYSVVAKEPGYFAQSTTFTVTAGAAQPVSVTLDLAIDPNDPRWPKPVEQELGHFWVGAFGGVAWGPTFGSAAEAGCPGICSGRPSVVGWQAGGRAGFRFSEDTSVELSAAYFSMDLTSQRTRTDVFPASAPQYTVRYTLHDDIRYEGPLFGIGASQRVRLEDWLYLMPRATIGVLLGQVRNPITGTASTGGDSTPVQIAGSGDSVAATRLVVAPEIGAVVPWQGFELGLAVQAAFLPGSGVNFTYGAVQVAPSCPRSNPGAVGCAPSSSIVSGEQALGAFYVIVPQLQLRREF